MTAKIANEEGECASCVCPLEGPILFLYKVKGDASDDDSVSTLGSTLSFADEEDETEDLVDDLVKTLSPISPGKRTRSRRFSNSPKGRTGLQLGPLRRCRSTNNALRVARQNSIDSNEDNVPAKHKSPRPRFSRIRRCKGSFNTTKTTTSPSVLTCPSDLDITSGDPASSVVGSANMSMHSRASSHTRSLKRFSTNTNTKLTVADTSGLQRARGATGERREQNERCMAMPKTNRVRTLTGSKAPRMPPRKKTIDSSEKERVLQAEQEWRLKNQPKKDRLWPLPGSMAPRMPPRKKTNDSSEKECVLQAEQEWKQKGSVHSLELPKSAAIQVELTAQSEHCLEMRSIGTQIAPRRPDRRVSMEHCAVC